MISREITARDLDAIDAYLAQAVDSLEQTRKGKTWHVRISDHPIDVWVESDQEEPGTSQICLAAGLKSPLDYDLLRRLGQGIASLIGGECTEPTK